MSAPCGGCPPCCKQCVWSQAGQKPEAIETVVVEDYGCVRGGGQVVKTSKGIGLLLGGLFHSLTDKGMKFLEDSGNPLFNEI